jgi:hypothetical protein
MRVYACHGDDVEGEVIQLLHYSDADLLGGGCEQVGHSIDVEGEV